MKIAFVETMRGVVTSRSGAEVPIDFNVRASRDARGHFTLQGVVHAGPWVEETTCEGTLALSVLPARISYDVSFTATDGRRLRLHGAKRPSVFSPVTSMTVLPIALSDELGELLAEGTLTFALDELPGFLASWLPTPSRAHRQLEARRIAVARLPLRARG